jgi:hypothetical protein
MKKPRGNSSEAESGSGAVATKVPDECAGSSPASSTKSQTTDLEKLAHETTGAVLRELGLIKDVVDNMKSSGVPLAIQRAASNDSASKITNIIHEALCKVSGGKA